MAAVEEVDLVLRGRTVRQPGKRPYGDHLHRAWEKCKRDRREESQGAHWRAYVRGRGLTRGQLAQ